MEKHRAKDSQNIFEEQDEFLLLHYKARIIKSVVFMQRKTSRPMDRKENSEIAPLYFEVPEESFRTLGK